MTGAANGAKQAQATWQATMKLVLHIGTEKTGSTSLQRWAWDNGARLADQGIHVSRRLGGPPHQKLHCWALGQFGGDDALARIGVHSDADYQAFRAGFPGELAAEIRLARDAGCHTVLMSSEFCHSRLVRPEQVRRLRDLLQPHFDEIDVLCCLRPQIDLAVSLMSTAARIGFNLSGSYLDRVAPEAAYYDYAAMVRRWSDAFGGTAVSLIAYRRHPDIIADLIARLGLDVSGFDAPRRQNSAIDVRTLAMMNTGLAAMVRRGTPPRAPIRQALDMIACTRPLNPGLETARRIQARFDDVNAALETARPDLEPGDLTPDWSRYEGPSNLHVLDEPCIFAEQLAELLDHLQSGHALQTARLQLTIAERALGNNRPEVAATALNSYGDEIAAIPDGYDPGAMAQLAKRAERIGKRVARKLAGAGR